MAGRSGASEDNVIWGVDFTKGRPSVTNPWQYDLDRALAFYDSHWPTPEGDEFVGPDGDCA